MNILRTIMHAIHDAWFPLVALLLAGISRPFIEARRSIGFGPEVPSRLMFANGVADLKRQGRDHLLWTLRVLADCFVIGVALIGWAMLGADCGKGWDSLAVPLGLLCTAALVARWHPGMRAMNVGIGWGLRIVGVALFCAQIGDYPDVNLSAGFGLAFVMRSLSAALFLVFPPIDARSEPSLARG